MTHLDVLKAQVAFVAMRTMVEEGAGDCELTVETETVDRCVELAPGHAHSLGPSGYTVTVTIRCVEKSASQVLTLPFGHPENHTEWRVVAAVGRLLDRMESNVAP